MSTANVRLYNVNKIARAIHYIEQHLDDQLNVHHLADITFNAYDRFHHLFTQVAGEPVYAHIKRVRMERSAFLLRYSNYTINDIAFLVGFGSNASFTKAFTHTFDTSPKRYRTFKPVKITGKHKRFLLNYEHPEVKRMQEKEVVFFRANGMENIPHLWNRLHELQHTFEAVKGFTVVNTFSTPEIIFKTPDYPDITAPPFTRWDVGVSAEKEVIQALLNLEEHESLRHQIIPAGKYAIFLHNGPGWNIMDSYDAILYEGLHQLGYHLSQGINYHKYLKLNLTSPSLVELYFPIN